MVKRANTVELVAGERRESFEISHAERLLRLENNGGWELPADSNYKMDATNGLTYKSNTTGDKEPGKNADNQQSK